MLQYLRSIILAVMVISVAGCSQFVDPDDPANSTSVRTTITGRVKDEAGKSVAGALVSGHGASATTNANGVFVLKNVSVPTTRAVVIVKKSGYFTGARAAYPSANKFTTMLLTLQEAKPTRTISASSGGKVTVGGASIDLPANGYVDAQGKSYTGTISVAARYLDPLTDNYYDSFSGDMAAIRTDKTSIELSSYGVVRALLTGSQGQTLSLANGATATITYPSVGATDAEIPLWYFDEKQGIWVEDGKATLVGGVYVGTVTHFTDWNLDKPNARRAILEGQVTCGENKPLAGIVVDIGQVTVVTDQEGMFRRRVPADFAFDVEVKASRNDGISCAPIAVGPIAENQTFRRDLVVSPCPTLLEAQFVDCDDAPIGGFLQVITPTGVKLGSSTTGRVLVTVPAGVALTLEGYSTDGRTITSTPVTPIASGTVYNAGNLKACSGVETSYLDIMMPDNEQARIAALNSNGTRVAVVTQQSVFMYDATTGTQLWSAAVPSPALYPASLKFVADDQRVALSTTQGTTFYDATTGLITVTVVARGRQHATPDGASVYVLPDSNTVQQLDEYDAQSGVKKRSVPFGDQQTKGSLFLGLQGNGYAVIQLYSPLSINTVDLSSGTVVRTYNGGSDSTSIGEASSLSPSGKVLTLYLRSSGSNNGQMTFVDLTTGNTISQIASGASVYAISPDDAQYVSRSYTQGAPIALSSLSTQQLLRILPWSVSTQTDYPVGFSFSQDVSKLVGITPGGANGTSGSGKNARIRIFTIR